MSRDELKSRVVAQIDDVRDEIVGVVERIWSDPEVGYREHNTASLIAETFTRWGVPYRDGLALTGVKGELRGGGDGPAVAILGEMDALIVPDHPDAHPQRHAVHACGHNVQIGSMLGAVAGLLADGVLEQLSGRVVPMAVPAEECIDIEGRLELRQEGAIEFLVGKAELIRLGAFDDVDMAMLVHAGNQGPEKFLLPQTNNGAIIKHVQFLGRAAHGAAPHRGVNALAAAMLALAGIDAQRATFRDEDTVRVHPILTAGGASASVIPAEARLETFVRAKTLEAMVDANTKVDRALRAGGMALGATVRISTLPGYLPRTQDPSLERIFVDNAAQLVGSDSISREGHKHASTDLGDLSTLMPVIQPLAACATGIGHGATYQVVDLDNAVITAAKAMAMTTIDLLADRAAQARNIKDQFTPRLTKDGYLEIVRALASENEYTY